MPTAAVKSLSLSPADRAYSLSGNNNFILTFRGTQPNEWQDIKADLDVKKVNSSTVDGHVEGKVHRGFKYALNDVWKDVVEHMEKCNANQKQVNELKKEWQLLKTHTDNATDSIAS